MAALRAERESRRDRPAGPHFHDADRLDVRK